MAATLYKNIPIADNGIRKLRFGDLNNDGIDEFILVQTYPMNREICCITAIDQNGNVLWQHGEPVYCNWAYSDYPAQVVDWDGDGKLEVLYIKQAICTRALFSNYVLHKGIEKDITDYHQARFNLDEAVSRTLEYNGNAQLVVLDGMTGQIKYAYETPAPADDCIALGHFDGTGKMNAVIKDRYWNVYALNNDGQIIWHVANTDLADEQGRSPDLGHYPAVGDLDGDGLDEVFLTNALIDHDGSIAWKIPLFCEWSHHDGAYILDDLPQPHIMECGDRIRLITAEGKILWEKDGGHWQMVLPGRFSADPKHGPYQFVGCDINPGSNDYIEGANGINNGGKFGERLTMFDWYGNVMWSREREQQGCMVCANWDGKNDCVVISYNQQFEDGTQDSITELIDASGNVFETIVYQGLQGENTAKYFMPPYIADVAGDSRDEILLMSNSCINIFINTELRQLRHHYNHSGFNMTPSHR